MEHSGEVERYAGLIAFVIRQHRLSPAAAVLISGRVWRRLDEYLTGVACRAGLPGWLAATTQQECERVLRNAGRAVHGDGVPDAGHLIVALAERRQTLLDAIAALDPDDRQALRALREADGVAPTRVLNKLRNTIISHYTAPQQRR